MLGQPISMLIPEVDRLQAHRQAAEGVTATDLVLTVTQMLRKKGVVGKFVEFYGPGLDDMPSPTAPPSATWRPNTAPPAASSRSTRSTIDYLTVTGRTAERIALVEAYAKAQGMWRTADTPDPVFTDTLELDLGDVQPSLAGPEAPAGPRAARRRQGAFDDGHGHRVPQGRPSSASACKVEGANYDLGHGDVVIAAITSCTNTSNPSVMIGAGLLARNAVAKGLRTKPWVKTSLAPGSQVVAEYLEKAGLQDGPRQARLQPRRLRLHHLHRQFRAAARSRSRRRSTTTTWWPLGALRQPQLRGPRQPGRARQLPRLAAARRRLRARRLDAGRPRQGAARHRQRRQAGLPEGHLAVQHGGAEFIDRTVTRELFKSALRRRLHRRRELAGRRGRRRASPSSGTAARPTCRTRPISRA